MSTTLTSFATTTLSIRWKCNEDTPLMYFFPLQVLLWLDKNATQEFSPNVELMDVNKLIGSMETESVYRQMKRLVEKADLLRYEVLPTNPQNSSRLCSNMEGYTLT